MSDAELTARLAFCRDSKIFCHAGGRNGGLANYGYPCVTGWISYDDGFSSHTERCIYCGSNK